MQNQNLPEGLLMVLTTESDAKTANVLGKELLVRRLAACVSIREVNSNFWWNGRIESNIEAQILIKTTKQNSQGLISAIKELHSYQTPEIIFWSVSSHPLYKSWVEDVVLPDS